MAERFDRHRAWIVSGTAIAVLLLAAATQLLPWLTQQREVVSGTPVRDELAGLHPIVLRAGQRACIGDVTLESSASIAQLRIARKGPSGRLALEMAGSDYAARTTLPVTPRRGARLDIPFAPPRRAVVGTVCLRNVGRHELALAGTGDPRALTRSTIVIDGQRQPEAFSLTLREAGTRSYLDQAARLIDRAATLSAVGPWLLWLLLPLLVLGVPAAVIAALHLALRESEPVSGRARPGPGRSTRPARD